MKLSQYGFNSVLFQLFQILLKIQRTFLLFNILRYIYIYFIQLSIISDQFLLSSLSVTLIIDHTSLLIYLLQTNISSNQIKQYPKFLKRLNVFFYFELVEGRRERYHLLHFHLLSIRIGRHTFLNIISTGGRDSWAHGQVRAGWRARRAAYKTVVRVKYLCASFLLNTFQYPTRVRAVLSNALYHLQQRQRYTYIYIYIYTRDAGVDEGKVGGKG